MSTQPLMKHEVVLPVIVDGYHWTCNQDRMWNLNELHRTLGLPPAKEPGQWRSSLKDKLVKDANLHVLAGRSGGTLATEEAAIAYAMWVSDDFYLKVIRAFIALRNDKVSEAKALAQDSKELKGLKPIARNWLEKLDNPKQGHTLTECLKNLDFRLGTKLVSAKALNAVLKHEVVLPVIVDGYHWTCNQDRMWNLNELHRTLGLPPAKEPGQWRSSLKDKLVKDANLHVLAGRSGGTLATEEAAIAYAMWVSDDFYLKVIRAFIALRNDKVSEAKALAQDSKELKGLKPIARNWLEKLDNPKQGHTLTECLKNLDFRLGTKLVSAKALNAVLKSGRIANPFYSRKLDGRGQPVFDISSGGWMTSFNPKGLENGYYRLQDNHYNGQEGLKVLTKGYEWLKSNKVELVRLCAKGGL